MREDVDGMSHGMSTDLTRVPRRFAWDVCGMCVECVRDVRGMYAGCTRGMRGM